MKNHRSLCRVKKIDYVVPEGGKIMLNTIIIVISVSLVLGGAVLTWWFENSPEKKEKPENESDGKAGNHS